MTWSIYKRPDGTSHVVPDEDLRPHSLAGCCCRPKRDYDDYMIFVHNSFDGREAYEQGKKKYS